MLGLEKEMIGGSKMKQEGDWLIKQSSGIVIGRSRSRRERDWLGQTSRSGREHPGSESMQQN